MVSFRSTADCEESQNYRFVCVSSLEVKVHDY